MVDTMETDCENWAADGNPVASRPSAAAIPMPATEVHHGWAWQAIMRQTLIIAGGLGAYLAVRAITAGSDSAAIENAGKLLRFERAIGLDWEAGMQQEAMRYDWVVTLANWIYSWTYWPIIIGTLAFTWFRHRHLFRRYRNALFVSGAVGLVIFALFPVAPPRFLSGYVDTLNSAARHQYIAHPSWLINENAALPSYHVGWVALSAVLVLPLLRSRWAKAVAFVPIIAMAATVVVTGNHYIVDILAGVAISLAALWVTVRHERRASGDGEPFTAATPDPGPVVDPAPES